MLQFDCIFEDLLLALLTLYVSTGLWLSCLNSTMPLAYSRFYHLFENLWHCFQMLHISKRTIWLVIQSLMIFLLLFRDQRRERNLSHHLVELIVQEQRTLLGHLLAPHPQHHLLTRQEMQCPCHSCSIMVALQNHWWCLALMAMEAWLLQQTRWYLHADPDIPFQSAI